MLDCLSHFTQAAFEEVISRFDADQFLRIGEGVDERFEFTGRAELIARSADEEFGFGTRAQKFEIVDAIFHGNRGQSQGDEGADASVIVSGAQSNPGAEGKTRKDDGQRELGFEPCERRAHVIDFADAVGVFAIAQAGAAEVEAKHGESEVVKRFHGVEYDFVVKRSTIERMWMAHQRGVRRGGRSGVEESFQASGGTGDE